jgi:Nucleotide modification associated domain 5
MATKKLSQADRDAFVKGVMADLPSIDYNAQAQKLVREYCESDMDPKVKAVYDDPKLVPLLGTFHFGMHGAGLNSFYIRGYSSDQFDKVRVVLDKKLRALGDREKAQHEARLSMRKEVACLIQSIATVKQAREQLPEFVKYLPTDTAAADRSVPAVVVGETVKLLKKNGWPTGSKEPK